MFFCCFFGLNLPMQILCNILYGVEARKSAGYCAMYDICGARTDGKVLNCPFNVPAVKVRDLSFIASCWFNFDIFFFDRANSKWFFFVCTVINDVVWFHKNVSQPDDLFSSKIQSLCPTITGNVCCTETQFDTLRSQVQQVKTTSQQQTYLLLILMF